MVTNAAAAVHEELSYGQETPLLTAAECAQVSQVIFDLREMWIHRQAPAPFYTLGLSTYLDAQDEAGQEVYYSNARYSNLYLSQCLGWLYQLIRDRLTQILACQVSFRRGCALPGFHIFTGIPEVESGIHVDLHHYKLRYLETEQPDFSRTVSFTLSIKLPPRGAGLNVWTSLPSEHPKFALRDDWVKWVFGHSPEHVPYREGCMLVHAGNLVHQMALGDVSPGQERITMQGHGVKCDGVWQLFW